MGNLTCVRRRCSSARDPKRTNGRDSLSWPGFLASPTSPLPSRTGTWLRQLTYLQAQGVKFDHRVEHGPTHSLYIRDPNGYSVELSYELPREVRQGDIEAAINHYVALPTEGPEALEDRAEGYPVFAVR